MSLTHSRDCSVPNSLQRLLCPSVTPGISVPHSRIFCIPHSPQGSLTWLGILALIGCRAEKRKWDLWVGQSPGVLPCNFRLDGYELPAELLAWLSCPGDTRGAASSLHGRCNSPSVSHPAGFGCSQKARREADHCPDHPPPLVTALSWVPHTDTARSCCSPGAESSLSTAEL